MHMVNQDVSNYQLERNFPVRVLAARSPGYVLRNALQVALMIREDEEWSQISGQDSLGVLTLTLERNIRGLKIH